MSNYKLPPEEPEPEQFGFQRDNSYAPSPAEIHEQREAIKAKLSPRELRIRGAWMHSGPWRAPEVAVFDVDED